MFSKKDLKCSSMPIKPMTPRVSCTPSRITVNNPLEVKKYVNEVLNRALGLMGDSVTAYKQALEKNSDTENLLSSTMGLLTAVKDRDVISCSERDQLLDVTLNLLNHVREQIRRHQESCADPLVIEALRISEESLLIAHGLTMNILNAQMALNQGGFPGKQKVNFYQGGVKENQQGFAGGEKLFSRSQGRVEEGNDLEDCVDDGGEQVVYDGSGFQGQRGSQQQQQQFQQQREQQQLQQEQLQRQDREQLQKLQQQRELLQQQKRGQVFFEQSQGRVGERGQEDCVDDGGEQEVSLKSEYSQYPIGSQEQRQQLQQQQLQEQQLQEQQLQQKLQQPYQQFQQEQYQRLQQEQQQQQQEHLQQQQLQQGRIEKSQVCADAEGEKDVSLRSGSQQQLSQQLSQQQIQQAQRQQQFDGGQIQHFEPSREKVEGTSDLEECVDDDGTVYLINKEEEEIIRSGFSQVSRGSQEQRQQLQKQQFQQPGYADPSQAKVGETNPDHVYADEEQAVYVESGFSQGQPGQQQQLEQEQPFSGVQDRGNSDGNQYNNPYNNEMNASEPNSDADNLLLGLISKSQNQIHQTSNFDSSDQRNLEVTQVNNANVLNARDQNAGNDVDVNNLRLGFLSLNQNRPDTTRETGQESFMGNQFDSIKRLLTGDFSLGDSNGKVMYATFALCVGVAVGCFFCKMCKDECAFSKMTTETLCRCAGICGCMKKP